MSVVHVVGDLLGSDEKFVAHGCNTQGVMGAGIAGLIAQRYPEVERSYRNLFEWCRTMNVERVAIPRIGCGIGGLDWNSVEWVIRGIYDWVPDGPEVAVYTLPSEVHKWV